MGFFDLKATCVVCNEETGLNRNKTKHGWVCRSCMDKLLKHNITILNISKHPLEELKRLVGVSMEPADNAVSLTPYERLQNLIIKDPSLSLKPGEVCFYEGKAVAYHEKNVVTGYKGGGAGISVRVAKGLSVHTGSGAKQAVRENVAEKYSGTFYITNSRLVLLAPKYGFDIPVNKVSSIRNFNDGIEIYSRGKCYSVLTKDMKLIEDIMELMNTAYTEQESAATESKEKKADPADEIMKYKKLLDAGAITQEEYDVKKKQLLGL